MIRAYRLSCGQVPIPASSRAYEAIFSQQRRPASTAPESPKPRLHCPPHTTANAVVSENIIRIWNGILAENRFLLKGDDFAPSVCVLGVAHHNSVA
jgi:hypothetical protein